MPDRHEYLIKGALQQGSRDPSLDKANGQVNLNLRQVSVLRSHILGYLNLLEVVFASWRHNIADREIIRAEFGHLVTPQKDHFPLDKIRIATGVYSSIAEFSAFMKQMYSRQTGKGPVA